MMVRGLTAIACAAALGGCMMTASTRIDPGSAAGVPPAPGACHARGTGVFSEPDLRCSPGATNRAVTQATIGATICAKGWAATVRPPERVTGPEKRVELRAYGDAGPAGGFELDHIVSLELGGAPNAWANFWPEPNFAHRQGFYWNPKDELENRLRVLVCSGGMRLVVAQRLIASDWPAAYRRYVGSVGRRFSARFGLRLGLGAGRGR